MKNLQDIIKELLQDKSRKSPYKPQTNLKIESLENRSLLAAHPLADAPDVDFNVSEQWESGHTADLKITNDEGTAFSNWQLEFDYDGNVSSFWNANVASDGNGHYTVTPPSWDNTLDPGESLGVGIVADGQPGDLRNVTFNGVAEQNDSSDSPASAPEAPAVDVPTENAPEDQSGNNDPVAPVAGSPSTPSVSVLTNWEIGGYDVSVNLWSGEPAESWKVYENGELIHEEAFDSTDATPQSAKVNISDNTYGVYTYQVEVSNAAGTTASTQVTHVVGGASQIEIASEDVNSQALQLTIDQGTAEYTLSIGESESASFSVATNNSRVISAEMIDTDTLRVTGLDAGRASLKITDAETGETRYLGFRVRTADGELPGLPDYLTIGSVSEDSAGDLAFWQDFDGTDSATNKYVDSRYIYLNGGPVNGWRTWGDRVGSYVRESLKLGMIPQFVYYNIPDGGESFTTNNEHLASTEYMEGYFNDLKFALDEIKSEAGDELVQFIMEPDFIGYLMQNANAPASALPAMTSAAYSSGVLEAGVDPQFDNTVTGLINAINYTISNHEANVEFGWQFNLWASPGIETPIGSQGICHLTDTMGIEAGRTAIAREAELIAEYYMDAGILSYGADFISVDKYGLDAGAQNGAAEDPASSTWFWNADHWNNYLLVVKTLTETTGKEMILWQIPVGHINDSLATNPYDESGSFESLDNTTRQYEDSAPTYFLGDTFTATGVRYDHFAANEEGDAKISSDGNTITWESHMEEARAAGVRQILFGAGVGISTDSIGTEPTDDYWWITKVQEYYQNPVEMEGTTVAPPTEVEDAPADPVTPPAETIDPPADPVLPPAEVTDPPAEDTAPPAESDGSEADPVSQPVVAAYYPEWGIYGRDYQIADVPAEDLTHFIYAFANLTANGEMVLFDSYAATEKRFSAEDSVSGEADLWSYPAEDPRSQQTVWGNFNQLAQLKEKYPHLRTSIALGGWTLSGNFSSVCSTATGRETLASSIYDFLSTYSVFDGIDFDWEYPGGGGLSSNGVSPQDGENYALLLGLVRDKLDQLGAETDRYYEITVASPVGHDKVANFNLEGLKEHVDFFNVMAYDFHGTWEDTTGHQAALTNDPNGYDIATGIDLYLDAGVEREQIVLGAPAYTRAWSGVADGGDNGYDESTSGAAPGSFEKGTYDYKDLASQYLSGTGDWELNWDDDAQAAYLYSESEGIFSSFETPGTISFKSEWAQDLGLGGMMFWDLSNDMTGSESLIGAAADSWLGGKTFNEITSASDLVFENIYGGNGLFDAIVEVDTTPSLPQVPANNGNNNTGSNENDNPVAPAPVESVDPPAEAVDQPANDPVVAPIDPVQTPQGSAAVSYNVASSWASGLTGNITIKNTASEPVDGWTLEFTYAGDIQSIWDAQIVSRDGDRYVISNIGWNGSIAPGAELSFGFTAAGSDVEGPTDVIFNGVSTTL